MLLLLLNYVVLRALRKIDVHLIRTLVSLFIIIIIKQLKGALGIISEHWSDPVDNVTRVDTIQDIVKWCWITG